MAARDLTLPGLENWPQVIVWYLCMTWHSWQTIVLGEFKRGQASVTQHALKGGMEVEQQAVGANSYFGRSTGFVRCSICLTVGVTFL